MPKDKNLMPTALEANVLKLMMARGAHIECFGLELVENSNGLLKKGSIYVTLGRMEDKGFINGRKEKQQPGARGLPRRLYKITAPGKKVLEAYEAQQFNIEAAWQ